MKTILEISGYKLVTDKQPNKYNVILHNDILHVINGDKTTTVLRFIAIVLSEGNIDKSDTDELIFSFIAISRDFRPKKQEFDYTSITPLVEDAKDSS